MPEGDTVFRMACGLERALAGRVVTRFESAYAPLARVHDQSPVTGRTIERIESRGKWLLFHFSGDLILLTHMLMSGSWHIYRPGERWKRARRHMRIVVGTAAFEAVAFDVPVARFHSAATLRRSTAVQSLGPDLLGSAFPQEEAAQRLLAHPEEEVGSVLLNQRVMAGIGNVFKSEICFACGVNPFRLVRSLLPQEIECLLWTARKLLLLNVTPALKDAFAPSAGGRRTTRSGDPAGRLWVYRRQGRPCRRCGTAILMRKKGADARSTYWCPECQSFAAGECLG